jgi:sulfonate transport system substrate-binding protein
MKAISRGAGLLLFLGVSLFTVEHVQSLNAPTVIRIAIPGVGIGNRPVVGGEALSTAHIRGALEEEFKPDNIRIEWSFLRGAGPAVNELWANGLTDFSSLGDLPSVVGRASGLKTKLLFSRTRYNNIYVVVPSDSPIQTVADLRGKRVSVFKGTATQLAANRILESFGLKESEVRTINMDNATTRAALVTKDVDASFGASDLLQLRDQGAVRVIYTTRGKDPSLTTNGTFLGSQDFIERYPQHTQRVVNAILKQAKWLGDLDKNPSPAFMLWTKSGVQFSNYKEDYLGGASGPAGESLKRRTNPLIDEFLVARYTSNIQDAQKFKLLRNSFRFEDWVDRRFLNAGLKQLGLEQYWQPDAALGKKPQG